MIAANVIFAVFAGCPTTQVVNKTDEWNKQDKQALSTANKSCEQRYEHSPCLKLFIKVEEGVYQAICGAPKK